MSKTTVFVSALMVVAALMAGACRQVTAPAGHTGGEDAVMKSLGTTVKIDSGTVEGALEGDVQVFRGMPYAAAPLGDLRGRAPQPVAGWSGVRQATSYGADCIQAPNDIEKIQTTPSEDCLYLNVWRRADTAGEQGLPVLVWIHGGGFVGGGSSIPWYDGSAFARGGIVAVSFNYRLGRLGFFAHPAVLAARGDEPAGNFGLMDQIAALEWVQRNIQAFGGDPQNVTLMGQSAGGASVLALMTSPRTRGLFEQVVVLSAGGREGLLSKAMTGGTAAQPSADIIDAAFGESLGITGSGPEALAALRALPAAAVQGDLNLGKLAQVALLGDQVYAGTQMIDGDILIGQPGEILNGGAAPALPMIIGTTALDLPAVFPATKLDPLAFFGDNALKARDAYAVPEELDRNSLAALLLSIGADMTMHEPARYVAKQLTSQGAPVWLYRFTYTAESTRPDKMAQGHAGELPFLFDQLAAQYDAAVTPEDEATAHAFHTFVANFVKSGDPNGRGLPEWPWFSPANFELMHFSLDGPVYERDPRADRVELVEEARRAR